MRTQASVASVISGIRAILESFSGAGPLPSEVEELQNGGKLQPSASMYETIWVVLDEYEKSIPKEIPRRSTRREA